MNKLIIHIDNPNVTDEEAIINILGVIKQGKVSANGTAYAYVVTFKEGGKVIATKTPYGHKFHVGRWDK